MSNDNQDTPKKNGLTKTEMLGIAVLLILVIGMGIPRPQIVKNYDQTKWSEIVGIRHMHPERYRD